MQDKVLNHDKTKALLIHATAASSTKEVADLISVSAPRISEGKDKGWRIPKDKAEILVEKFGPPRAETGSYFEAEVWNSFSEFKEKSPEVVANTQLSKIVKILNDKSKLNIFLDSIELIEDKKSDQSELRKVRLAAINELIYHPVFIQWQSFIKSKSEGGKLSGNVNYRDLMNVSSDYLLENSPDDSMRHLRQKNSEMRVKNPEQYRHFAHNVILYSEPKSLNQLLKDLGIRCINSIFDYNTYEPFRSYLYLISEFSANFHLISGVLNRPLSDSRYIVGSTIDFDYNIHHQPVVLTGNVIWTEEIAGFVKPLIYSGFELLPNLKHFDMLPDSFVGDPYEGLAHSPVYEGLYVGPGRYNGFNVQLNLSKSMTYHLHFQLGKVIANEHLDISNGRTIVIKNISADTIFDVLTDFSKHFNLTYLPLIEIKEMVAKNGGFIPGAMYLE
jgi:hypothetical protein